MINLNRQRALTAVAVAIGVVIGVLGTTIVVSAGTGGTAAAGRLETEAAVPAVDSEPALTTTRPGQTLVESVIDPPAADNDDLPDLDLTEIDLTEIDLPDIDLQLDLLGDDDTAVNSASSTVPAAVEPLAEPVVERPLKTVDDPGRWAIDPATTAAPAATYDPWYQVRMCESHNNYAINTGNGFYGAYQFTISTWNWVAGMVLPAYVGVRPDLAPPWAQDRMATALAFEVAGGGLHHWPICGSRYGT